ncbi:unnamed protein product [Paramecium primaurelia]|uniref:Uncharacterized protein n=1 Tax=Paramecium primaurelia TaxID=5886 RepID=A0A8S1KQ52_PARPR|nr:unnamed protein product [Paramecium primaurelia]
MDDIYSQMTDKFNCDSSNRTDDYFMQVCQPLSSNRCQQIEEIEFKFRQSKQDYVFPRIPFEETPDKYQTIQSPHRLKTEGNEKSEDQLDLNFNFNSSSEHISDDAVVLQPKTYQQKLKPPQPKKPKNAVTQQTYRTILNDLERKLHTINCKDFIKKKYEQKGASRAKSNSNSTTHYNSHYQRKPFEIDTKTSSVKKSIPTESKKSLSKTTLAAILLKQKSKSNPSKTNNIFNVNNSHINLNVNINSQTMDLQQQALTVAQILQKKQLLNRSSLSSYQRNSNRCSTEPLEEMKARLSNNHQKNKTTVTNQSRCNTGMDVRAQSTIQYLNQMKKQQIKKYQKQQQQQQQIQQKQQPTMQIKPQQNIKQRSSTNTSKPRISSGKYKKYNLSIQMN